MLEPAGLRRRCWTSIQRLHAGRGPGDHPGAGSPRTRPRSRCGCCWPPTRPARASTCRRTATGWSTSTSRSTRPGWSSASAGSTATGRHNRPEIFHFVPVASSTTYADDLAFMGRIAEKVGTIAADLGSVNQVIDADIQRHFARSGAPAPVVESRSDGTNVVNQALAGGIELNRRLTELSRTYAERKGALHLTPGNARRVVDTALRLTAQPVLIEVGDDRTDAEVFEVPALGSSWQPALRGLDTRLRAWAVAPDHLRRPGRGRPDRPGLHPPWPRSPAEGCPDPAQRSVQRGRRGEPRDRGSRRRPAAVVRGRGVTAGAGRPRRDPAARGGVPRWHPAAWSGDGRGQGGEAPRGRPRPHRPAARKPACADRVDQGVERARLAGCAAGCWTR